MSINDPVKDCLIANQPTQEFTPKLFRNIVEGDGIIYIIPKGCRKDLEET